MVTLSTNQVAKKLGIGIATLTRHIQSGKVIAPPETVAGGMRMRSALVSKRLIPPRECQKSKRHIRCLVAPEFLLTATHSEVPSFRPGYGVVVRGRNLNMERRIGK